ncbi:hypothetical protein NEFER03_0788 [Nematocida sp. LUAm3]|nr:hypothetical protein NEFER03_0788 [Nematocida sp. LUAm3]KAI5175247.1 hypothetical protein NEFER02_1208 [Nematocida sp. LUAm2]
MTSQETHGACSEVEEEVCGHFLLKHLEVAPGVIQYGLFAPCYELIFNITELNTPEYRNLFSVVRRLDFLLCHNMVIETVRIPIPFILMLAEKTCSANITIAIKNISPLGHNLLSAKKSYERYMQRPSRKVTLEIAPPRLMKRLLFIVGQKGISTLCLTGICMYRMNILSHANLEPNYSLELRGVESFIMESKQPWLSFAEIKNVKCSSLSITRIEVEDIDLCSLHVFLQKECIQCLSLSWGIFKSLLEEINKKQSPVVFKLSSLSIHEMHDISFTVPMYWPKKKTLSTEIITESLFLYFSEPFAQKLLLAKRKKQFRDHLLACYNVRYTEKFELVSSEEQRDRCCSRTLTDSFFTNVLQKESKSPTQTVEEKKNSGMDSESTLASCSQERSPKTSNFIKPLHKPLHTSLRAKKSILSSSCRKEVYNEEALEKRVRRVRFHLPDE